MKLSQSKQYFPIDVKKLNKAIDILEELYAESHSINVYNLYEQLQQIKNNPNFESNKEELLLALSDEEFFSKHPNLVNFFFTKSEEVRSMTLISIYRIKETLEYNCSNCAFIISFTPEEEKKLSFEPSDFDPTKFKCPDCGTELERREKKKK